MKRGINRWLQVALAGVVVTAGAGVAGADQGMPGGMGEHRGPMMMAQSGGPGGHPGHGPGARAMNPEQAKARMNERIRRMLAGVGASEQQITQVQGIWASAMTDLAAIRSDRVAGRQAIADVLSRPTIDRRALEDARKQQQALADRASQRFTQALADAAEVLTPDQRAKLSELRRGRRGPGAGFMPGGFMS